MYLVLHSFLSSLVGIPSDCSDDILLSRVVAGITITTVVVAAPIANYNVNYLVIPSMYTPATNGLPYLLEKWYELPLLAPLP